MTKSPWDITPSLTEERLHLLVSEVARVRDDARAGHEPEKGDEGWVFGCRTYMRTCFAFGALKRSGDHPWLDVLMQGLACTVVVGGEPIKFYRGDSDSPSARSLRRGLDAAIMQGTLDFRDDDKASNEGWFWLLALETADDGSLLRAVFFQANKHGDTRNQYIVSVTPDGIVPALSVVGPAEREGRELAPPPVGSKAPRKDKAQSDKAKEPGAGDGGAD